MSAKTVQDLIDRIRRFQKWAGVSPMTLAKAAKLHTNTLRKMHDPKWNPEASTVDAVLKYIRSLKGRKC